MVFGERLLSVNGLAVRFEHALIKEQSRDQDLSLEREGISFFLCKGSQLVVSRIVQEIKAREVDLHSRRADGELSFRRCTHFILSFLS
jgi:hypothetical protein